MKIVSLILDGESRVRIAATCAPDLLRRQVSADTGTARLLWCGVPPLGISGAAVVAEFGRRLAATKEAPGVFRADPGGARRALETIMVLEPRRRERRRRFGRALRRLTGPARRLLYFRRPSAV